MLFKVVLNTHIFNTNVIQFRKIHVCNYNCQSHDHSILTLLQIEKKTGF